MAEAAADLRARLRRVAPQEARRRNALLARLNGAPTPLGRLSAAIDDAPSAAPVLVFTHGVAAAPVVVEGAPTSWLPAAAASTTPEALVELGRLEPLLAAVERRLGVALDPHEIGEPPPAGLWLRLVVRGQDGGERHALRLYVPSALPLPAPAPVVLRDLADVGGAAVRLRLLARSRPAPLAELPQLSAGDLVLADGEAQGGLAATLATGDGWTIVGRWRPQDGRFAQGGRMSDEPVEGARAAGGDPAAPPDMRVRLDLRLGEVEVALADLAALAPGAVLAAPLAGDAPRVEVVAGGAHIASGRLVALGEAYGVLIDEVKASAQPSGDRA